MMSKNVNILLVISVIFVALIESSNAIRCWDCNSNTDINCADPFNNRSVSAIDCREKCRKITQIVNGHTQYSRGCHDDPIALQDAELYICYSDGCNSARNHIPMLLTILAMPIIIGVTNLILHSRRS